MGRTVIVLLLLVVFFLTGMLFGMNQTDSVQIDDSHVLVDDQLLEEEFGHVYDVSYESDEYDVDDPIHFTHKTASVLEAGVKGFYEIIVGILYKISQLFF
ncbi:MAG TPA: hypothetical protein VF095_00780 [Bacillota bacterium]